MTTADIGVGYLNAKMPEDKQILMRLSRVNAAAILVWLKPEYGMYLQPNGTMVVKLTKALYGRIESAKLFYNHISDSLLSMGYQKNSIDICVFSKVVVEGVQATVCIHVDDLLITSMNQ